MSKKFLLINPFGIGDVLFTTPAIAALKAHYPDCTIGYWCNERVQGLLKHVPGVDKTFALSRGDLKRVFQSSWWQGFRKGLQLFSALRKERFDVCFDFSLDQRYAFTVKAAGVVTRIGFDYKGRGKFLTRALPLEGYTGRHVAEYYLDLIRAYGVPARREDAVLHLEPPAAARSKWQMLLGRHGIGPQDTLIGVAPGAGASWGKQALIKHWPAIRFAQLADMCIESCQAKMVLLGDERERSIADSVVYAMRHKPLDLVGKTSLGDLIALISLVKVLVTNDGGPLHIGVAAGTRTVSLFGPVSEEVYGPYPASDRHRVLVSAVSCRPCYRKFRMPECDRERECIQSISTETVFDAVQKSIAQGG